MLDLCCGTGSVGDVFEQAGFTVISVDREERYQPTILTDILTWDYRNAFCPDIHFEVISCGPPCTEFSVAKTLGKRDLDLADSLVLKCLEIVEFFQPTFWFLENPRGGLLKSRWYMEGIPFVDVDYCQFSDWGYQKPTRIWGSHSLLSLPSRLCDIKTCPNAGPRDNGGWAHNRVLGATPELGVPRVPREDQYQVPPLLIKYIASQVLAHPSPKPVEIDESEDPYLGMPELVPGSPRSDAGFKQGPNRVSVRVIEHVLPPVNTCFGQFSESEHVDPELVQRFACLRLALIHMFGLQTPWIAPP